MLAEEVTSCLPGLNWQRSHVRLPRVQSTESLGACLVSWETWGFKGSSQHSKFTVYVVRVFSVRICWPRSNRWVPLVLAARLRPIAQPRWCTVKAEWAWASTRNASELGSWVCLKRGMEASTGMQLGNAMVVMKDLEGLPVHCWYCCLDEASSRIAAGCPLFPRISFQPANPVKRRFGLRGWASVQRVRVWKGPGNAFNFLVETQTLSNLNAIIFRRKLLRRIVAVILSFRAAGSQIKWLAMRVQHCGRRRLKVTIILVSPWQPRAARAARRSSCFKATDIVRTELVCFRVVPSLM